MAAVSINSAPYKSAPGGAGVADDVTYVPRDYDGDKYIIALTRHTRAFWVAVLAALACNLGVLLGGLEYLGNYGLIAGVDNTMLTRVTVATMLCVTGVVTGALSIGFVYVLAARNTEVLGRVRTAGIVTAFAAGCIVAVGISFSTLMQMDQFYTALLPIDYNRQFWGGIIIVLYTLLAMTGFCIAGIILCRKPAPRHQALTFTQPVQPNGIAYRIWRVALAMLLLGVMFFLTMVLPCIWNGTDAAASLAGYFQTQSPVSLITTVWTFPQHGLNGDPGHDFLMWTGQLYLKLFPDVCVFFGMIAGLSLLGFIGSLYAPARRVLHKRLRLPSTRALPTPIHNWLRQWEVGVTVGEAILTSAVLALYGYWIWYWYAGNNRIVNTVASYGDAYPNLQIGARVLGHVTNLSMSLLILPVARNSVWEGVFGMPFERLIKYHRVLGRVAWISATMHMLFWQVKWLYEGTLKNNIVTVSNLIINTGNPPIVHQDNWSIPVAEAGWLVLTLALAFTQFRRRHYEAFHFAHHGVWVFLITSLIHSWGLWYYLVGGLLLAIVDKLMRAIKSARPVKVVSIATSGAVTRIAVDADIFKSGGYFAGQYAFVNFPAISLFEWHPFTISSAPSTTHTDRVVTFHIKAHAPGTWTSEVAALAAAAPHPGDVSMSIDGPYGRTGHYYERRTLVLVAGGIGITPLHSVLLDTYTRLAEPEVFAGAASAGAVQRVVLVWTCKEASLFACFADTLATIARSKLRASFELHLHYTGGGKAGVADALQSAATSETGLCDPSSAASIAPLIVTGRPDIPAIIARALQETQAAAARDGEAPRAPSDVLSTLVCGPESLVEQVSAAAFDANVDFHSEIFHF